MNSQIYTEIDNLPESIGIYSLINEKNESILVGASENIKKEVFRILKKHAFLRLGTKQIKTIEAAEKDLIRVFAQEIRRRKPRYNFTLSAQNLYPHLKITREKFPRLLATRQIENDAAEYFGAFLPVTKVRFLLGFLIDNFRLRGCDIPIDGNLPQPCPQFFRRKCLAPCVKNLCDEKSYTESVNLARLFLENNNEKLDNILLGKINSAAEALDFETATKWRDFRQAIIDFQTDKKREFRVDEASDSFEIKISDSKVLINLVTRKNRKILGRRIFVFETKADFTLAEILEQVLWQFYQFHTPREISVSVDFSSRRFLENILSLIANRRVKIIVSNSSNQKRTVIKALRRSKLEYEIEKIKPVTTFDEITNEISDEFSLIKKPLRIEAFDVAHISGVDFVGAKAVWEAGKFKPEEYEFWFLDEDNEPKAMAKTLANRFEIKEKMPELILIDGGRAQIAAAIESVKKINNGNKITVISSVKPPQKHGEISHFLTENNQTIPFKKDSAAFNLLLRLRDEAHDLANYVHRTKRETAHFSELFQISLSLTERERYFLLRRFGSIKRLKKAKETDLIKLLGKEKGRLISKELGREFIKVEPFIVPIRYYDPNGEAADLRPLFILNQGINRNNGKIK